MFRRLIRSVLGEFPPRGVPLCDQCRTAYNVVGIFGSPLSYDDMEDNLYNFALLCEKPCGAIRPKPPQPGTGFEIAQLFLKAGVICTNCNIALRTMIQIVSINTALNPNFSPSNNFAYEIHMLRLKDLACDKCLSAFRENHEDLMANFEGILQKAHERLSFTRRSSI